MESYQFYKSLYDRELKRRTDLEAAINLPLTLLTIIVASNSYLVREIDFEYISILTLLHLALISLTAIVLTISIFYLIRSFNNFFKGFLYRNIGLSAEIRKYEMDLEKYNSRIEKDKNVSFENIIIDKLTSIIDNHTHFNDKRSYDLYLAKIFLIISIIITIFNFISILLNYLFI